MQTTAALRAKAATLLAADATTLAPAALNNLIALVKSAFTPSEQTDVSTLVLADFDGSTPIAVGTGTQPTGADPNTNDEIISILPPAGGFRFATTGVTNLPQTIYGFILTDSTGATLYAAALLPAPVTLTASGQVIELPTVDIRQLAGSMT